MFFLDNRGLLGLHVLLFKLGKKPVPGFFSKLRLLGELSSDHERLKNKSMKFRVDLDVVDRVDVVHTVQDDFPNLLQPL